MGTYGTFLFLGLGNGGVFAALAMALVVTYRSSGVLNFATGAQALYVALWNLWVAAETGQLLHPHSGHAGRRCQRRVEPGLWPGAADHAGHSGGDGRRRFYLLFSRRLRDDRSVAKAVASIGLMGLLTAVVTYQVGMQRALSSTRSSRRTTSASSVSASRRTAPAAGTITLALC